MTGEPVIEVKALRLEEWMDPAVAAVGHPVASLYVERFWLPILGPSGYCMLRLFDRCLDTVAAVPAGYVLLVDDAAEALGLTGRRSGVFVRTLERLRMFGMIRVDALGTVEALEVRRLIAPLPARAVERLSPTLRAEHDRWMAS